MVVLLTDSNLGWRYLLNISSGPPSSCYLEGLASTAFSAARSPSFLLRAHPFPALFRPLFHGLLTTLPSAKELL